MLIQNPPVEVGGGVWMLGTTAYPVYLVRGAHEGIIIEGGISAIGSMLVRQLADLGIGPEFVRTAVVTHAHPDHVMAVPRLRQTFPGIRVVASAPAAAALSSEKALAFFRQIDSLITSALAAEPASPTMAEDRIAVEQVVKEGDSIPVDGSSWTVLETPGHSDCSISLHNADARVLVISDASGYYMPDAQTWWPNFFSGYAAYLRSLERLAGLDAEVLCLSHNGSLRGADAIRSYFAGAIASTKQYHDRIVADAKAGQTVRQIAEMLGAEIHAQLQTLPLDFFQKNCGLMVKQSLRHAGMET
jgi:glyoxylase-like metal-dependent hydrolase (beta-lactamase superfamily II)